MADAHRSKAYQNAVAKLRAQRLPCSLCGHEIDYSITGEAARKHPLAFQADHIVPLKLGGHPTDPTNLAASHRICNLRKGGRLGIKRKGNSRRW